MKTLKVLLQEVVSGLKSWASSTFAQDSNTVHKTGDETVGGKKTWTGVGIYQVGNLYHVAEDPCYVLKSSTMQEGVVPSGDRTAYTGYWQDKNLSILGYDRFAFYSTGVQAYEVNLRNKATNGSFDSNGSLIQSGYQLALHSNGNSELKIYAHTLPNGNNTWNLGDSTHKWNNLYATTTNTDTIQSVSGNLLMHSAGTDKVVAIYNGTRAADGGGIWLYGKDSDSGALVKLQIYNTTTSKYEGIVLDSVNFYPDKNNLINLGTSDYKWKALNGINPGALSLPSESPSQTNLDPTNWNTTGTAVNRFTPPTDGWLGVQVQSADTTNLTGQYVFAGRSTGGDTFWPSAQLSNLVGDFESGKLIGCVMIPVIAGKEYHVRIKMGKTLEQGSKIYASFYPCQGNV